MLLQFAFQRESEAQSGEVLGLKCWCFHSFLISSVMRGGLCFAHAVAGRLPGFGLFGKTKWSNQLFVVAVAQPISCSSGCCVGGLLWCIYSVFSIKVGAELALLCMYTLMYMNARVCISVFSLSLFSFLLFYLNKIQNFHFHLMF